MGKKMTYDLTPIKTNEEAARFETCVRASGGYNLDMENLNLKVLPSLAPIHVDYSARKATPVKNVQVNEAYTTSDTAKTLKIYKGSLAYVGMFIGNGTKGAKITAIDTSNKDFDSLTLDAAVGANLAKDDVLFEATAVGGTKQKNKANALNYAYTKVEEGATVTGVIQIYEIKRSKIGYPVFSDKDVEDLGARYHFVD